MLVGATVSLFAVDLETLTRDWREQPLEKLCGARPGGRASAALRHPGLAAADRAVPAARAAVPPAEARALFDALVEDRAAAHIYDAPFSALAELLAALARAEHDRALDLATLEAAPSAYPPELRPRDPAGGLAVWQADPAHLVAATKLAEVTPRSTDPDLWRDLAAAIVELGDAAAQPGVVIVAESP